MTFRTHLTPGIARALPRVAAEAWRDADLAPPRDVLAASRTTQTAVVELAEIGRVVRKRWTWPRRRDRWKGALRTTIAARSPARREFDALQRLVDLPGGPYAPTPLGWLERREHGALVACTLFLREIPHARDLARELRARRDAAERALLLERLAGFVRSMHDAGLVDLEMHPRNVLVDRDARVFKVDCAKQRVRRRAASAADRVRDLAALDVGLVRLANASERETFLRSYLGADAHAADVAALERSVAAGRELIDARESLRLP